MGFFKNLSGKIESWLLKDEINEFNNQQNNNQNKIQLSPEQIEELNKIGEMIQERQEYVNDQIAIIESEDHSIKPTQNDINRYFDYHVKYIDALKFNNVWSSSILINEDDYKSRGRVEGWDFLRESCGLPYGVINTDTLETEKKCWSVE